LKLTPTLTLLAALALLVSPALAAYTHEASTFAAGGGVSASAGFENLGVVGQPGIVDSSASAGYTANHGFLSVLGDGFKILYPVISATPGTLTFLLVTGTSSSGQSVDISNTGGSNLNWIVSKATNDSIFNFSPASGTNNSSISVTASAASLAAGTYSNTLTISGTGIDQTAQVLLNLTVSPTGTYTLAVRLLLATPGKGGGTVTSTSVPGISCSRNGGSSDVVCSHNFTAGSTVTLSQTRGSDSQWATWGAPGCGSNPDCQIVLNAPQGTDVTFPYSSMAKVNSSGNGYELLVSAYGNAATTDTINARAVTFVEGTPGSTILFNGNKTINLVGGLDAFYAPTSDFTTIQNALKLGGTGRLNIKGAVKIHQ
jgi:hypothetical protein